MSAAHPSKGVILGVDFGTVRVGLAVTDPDRIIASPLETHNRRSEALDAEYFVQVAKQYGAVLWVVGLPLHSSGEESDKSGEARVFGAWLTQLSGLPVIYWDERFTSAMAEEALLGAKMTRKKRKERVDRVAAQLILQGYLAAGCPAEGTESLPAREPPDDIR